MGLCLCVFKRISKKDNYSMQKKLLKVWIFNQNSVWNNRHCEPTKRGKSDQKSIINAWN